MKRSQKLLAPLFLVAALVAIASLVPEAKAAETGDSANWLTDFAAAEAVAKASGKPLLLEFTGSDWCPPCMALNRDVFSQPAFKDYADEALVLVKLDFPRNKPQTNAVKAQNERLAEQFAIRGFPTILLLSPEGEMIGKTGYRRGGAEAYVEHLKDILGSDG
jgi:protein disulfide-isomerase